MLTNIDRGATWTQHG